MHVVLSMATYTHVRIYITYQPSSQGWGLVIIIHVQYTVSTCNDVVLFRCSDWVWVSFLYN